MVTSDEILTVWKRGAFVKGKKPELYRKDAYGNLIHFLSYGKANRLGWEIDHKTPISTSGSESIRNKEPFQWLKDRRKILTTDKSV